MQGDPRKLARGIESGAGHARSPPSRWLVARRRGGGAHDLSPARATVARARADSARPGEGRDPRPGPLPRATPGDGARLLGARGRAPAAQPRQHHPRTGERLRHRQAGTWRPFGLGAAGRAPAEHRADGRSGQGGQPCRARGGRRLPMPASRRWRRAIGPACSCCGAATRRPSWRAFPRWRRRGTA